MTKWGSIASCIMLVLYVGQFLIRLTKCQNALRAGHSFPRALQWSFIYDPTVANPVQPRNNDYDQPQAPSYAAMPPIRNQSYAPAPPEETSHWATLARLLTPPPSTEGNDDRTRAHYTRAPNQEQDDVVSVASYPPDRHEEEKMSLTIPQHVLQIMHKVGIKSPQTTSQGSRVQTPPPSGHDLITHD